MICNVEDQISLLTLCTEKLIFIINILTVNTYKYKFLEFTKHRKHHKKGANIKLRLK